MASTGVMALGWLVNIWVAYKGGVDTSLVGMPSFVGVLLCGVLPMVCGEIVFDGRRRSRRSADVAFAACMIVQGVALAMLPMVRMDAAMGSAGG